MTDTSIPSFRYVVVTPGGKATLLDAAQISAGDDGNAVGQIHSLVGWIITRTVLPTPVGSLVVVQDEGSATDAKLADNPLARDLVTALGGPDRRCGGVQVFCAAGVDGELAGLTDEQVEVIGEALRSVTPQPVR